MYFEIADWWCSWCWCGSVAVWYCGTIHFVIHNKSRPQPGPPQSVPKILMTLSGDDCLGWHATPVTLSYWDSIGQTCHVVCCSQLTVRRENLTPLTRTRRTELTTLTRSSVMTLSTKHVVLTLYILSLTLVGIFYFVIYENNRQSSPLQIPDTKKGQWASRFYFTWEVLTNEASVFGHTGRV